MDLKTLLCEREFIFLDGAMGTMLFDKGLKMGEIPELKNIESPEWIIDIHKQYIAAGSDIIYANTFGANSYKLSRSGKTVSEVVRAAIKNARIAAEGSDTLVALDIGPIGQLLEPAGTLSFEKAYDIYKEIIEAGCDADLIVFETMTDLHELKAAVLAAKENSDLPIITTMTFEENKRTFTGCSVSAMAYTIGGLGVDAIGVNCSLGPKELMPIVEEMARDTSLPIVLKPNAGLPDSVTGEYGIDAPGFAELMTELIPLGVKFVGGCCGTSPDFIRELKKAYSGRKYQKTVPALEPVCCTPANTVRISCPRVIGERINPTGKKRFKEALLNNDIDYILTQAIEQQHAGADILDVNVGLPGIDEKEMMVRVVKALQEITDLPLQLDSTDPEVIEAGLRIYNGKAIVNSVNGEEKSLQNVLPLVKKYGAGVVGLCLDENGIPKTAEARFAIAEKIVKRAEALGIDRRNVFIDCLTLTASAEQEGVMQTLEALERVVKELGCRTVLGVSNISFGLPSREIVNSHFLTMALTKGLTLPIINPNIDAMMQSVRAYKLLANHDKGSVDFIAHYGNTEALAAKPAEKAASDDLPYAIFNGLKGEGARITRDLLGKKDAMEIIDTMLIPALDKTGSDFEAGRIFLPQLIQSAGVAQACFEVIKEHLAASGKTSESKGKIVLATVKGDVHDIGKNIVKVLLENYGYDVIDLGKDVDCQLVVDTAIREQVKLVGLSALMTTTLPSMEKTITLLHEQYPGCKVVVGGAVLTPDYAESIGADFYARDAKESCDIAKRVFSGE
ncbi:MAG: homocysteine S-methyltransferase family protein [Ruminococcus sp.]|nr:homocysteine S-methyltransferase family protein [Ruminococcus sp.]